MKFKYEENIKYIEISDRVSYSQCSAYLVH